MGPSGAGKTSLMNILAGRVSTNAKVTVKGKYSERRGRFRAIPATVAYVMQDDALFATRRQERPSDFLPWVAPPSDVRRLPLRG